MEDNPKNPQDREIARLMRTLETHAIVAAGHPFDLASGKRRLMTWLAEGGGHAGAADPLPWSVASGARLEVSQLRYNSPATRILLGGRLRRLREAAGFFVEEAAREIRASNSKISRMENGRIGFKERDVVDLLNLYGVTDPHERDELLYLVRQSNEPAWWRDYADVLSERHQIYVGLEDAAVEIRTYDAQHVPELLQTEDYARALARQANPGADDWEIGRRLQILKERQAALMRSDAPRLRSLIDEAALRRLVGDAGVMRDQLRYLTEASNLPGTAIQVIPLSSGAASVVGCSFVLLHFADPDVRDVVYIEQLTTSLIMERSSEVAGYTAALDAMEGYAEGPHRLAAILGKLLEGQSGGLTLARPSADTDRLRVPWSSADDQGWCAGGARAAT